MNEQTEQQATAFLAGLRENLLKPMAGEICQKQKEEIANLRKKIYGLYILAIVQLILTVVVALVF